jgi:hypothetical protein
MKMDSAFNITALIGGTALLFQFVMMMMGLSDDGSSDIAGGADGGDLSGGVDADMSGGMDAGDMAGAEGAADHQSSWREAADAELSHHDGNWFYEIISIRTLSAALTFFGLTGKMMLAYGFSPMQSLLWAAFAGVVAMYVVYWLFKQVLKLQHSGNENVRNAIGLPATVYVPIPGKQAGAGKVTFRLQNRLVEYLAVTEDESRLPTGENVVIVAVVNSDTVRVERAEKPVPA